MWRLMCTLWNIHTAMPCRVDATCVKALLLTILALAACVTPASSQIHWNRGWGAGGSMGKRTPSASSPASSPAALGIDAEAMMPSSECSFDLAHVSNLLARIIESEASRLSGCDGRARYSAVPPLMGAEQDSLQGRLPWWYAARKASNDQ